MSDGLRSIEVYADWIGLRETTRLGTLVVNDTREKAIFSFEYDEAWLNREDGRNLDPDLRLFGGPQYAGMDKPNARGSHPFRIGDDPGRTQGWGRCPGRGRNVSI